MKTISHILVLAIILFKSFLLQAQCDITNVTWTNQACNANGEFTTLLDFDFSGTSQEFTLQTNYTWQTFSLSDLPVTVGPLPGYCTLNNFSYLISTLGCEAGGVAPYECCPNVACALTINEVEFECTHNGMAMAVDFTEFGCLQSSNYEIIIEKYDAFANFLSSHTFGPFSYQSNNNNKNILIPHPILCENYMVLKIKDTSTNQTAMRTLEETCCACGVSLGQNILSNCDGNTANLSFQAYNNNESELFGVNGYTVSIDGIVIDTLSLSDAQQVVVPASCSGQQRLFTITDLNDINCTASRMIDDPCCPCELFVTKTTVTNCDDNLFDVVFELSETGSCVYGDYYFILDGTSYDIEDLGNNNFSASSIESIDSMVNVEVCSTVAPYCFPLSFLNPCYFPVTNDSCNISGFTVETNYTCENEFAVLSFDFNANDFFGQNGYLVKFGNQSKLYTLNDEKKFNGFALCNNQNTITISDAINPNCTSQQTIDSLCCPCKLDSVDVYPLQCHNGTISIGVKLHNLSGSCYFRTWSATVNDSSYALVLANDLYFANGIFSSDSIIEIKVCSDFGDCFNSTFINPCYDFISDTNRIQFEVVDVRNIKCEKTGYVTWVQSGALPDFKIYLDNVLQPGQLNDIYVNTAGFHSLTISDAFLQKTIVFWIDNLGDTSTFDVSPVLVAGDFERGFVSDAFLTVRNLSCKPVDTYVTLKYPNHIQYQGSYPSAIDQQNQLLEWYLDDLVDSIVIHIKFKTISIAPLGHKLIFDVNAFPTLDDNNPSNNSKQYTYLVTGSYDPNNKSTIPLGECDAHYILKNQVINYTIRFQNIGDAAAKNVLVKDELNEYFDLSTFRLLSSSHHGYVIKERDNTLSFKFDNIFLAAQAVDENTSKGYISFEIKPKNNTPIHTLLKNKASIYFDFNDAIVTNETFHTIIDRIPITENEISLNTCKGQVFRINNEEFTTDTTFVKKFTNKFGCDSLVSYDLTFDDPIFDTIQYTICEGDVIVIDGNHYSEDIIILKPTRCNGLTTQVVNVVDALNININLVDNILLLDQGLFDNYTWIDCSDNSIVSTGLPSFSPAYNGEFKLSVEKDGCFYESDCVSFLINNTKDLMGSGIVFYPNPVDNKVVNIRLKEVTEKIQTVAFINTLGKHVFILNGHNTEIKIPENLSGVHMLKVVTQQNEYLKKIIIK